MGLDMYLHRVNKADRKKYKELKEQGYEDIKLDYEEVAYWRKANQIREWIVNNTKYESDWDCVSIKIGKKKLKKLRDDCKAVLEDHSKANELMPTSSGFFFGDTDYDEYYYNVLNNTVKMINKILDETDFETQRIEYYEWW